MLFHHAKVSLRDVCSISLILREFPSYIESFCHICQDITITIFLGRDVSKPNSGTIHNVFEDPVVMKIAKVHGKTPAQVLLRHQMQNGIGR